MTVATTGDTAQSFSIASGNGDGIFAISNAGVITIASTSNLDYEATTSYTLSIQGTAGSSSDRERHDINRRRQRPNSCIFRRRHHAGSQ